MSIISEFFEATISAKLFLPSAGAQSDEGEMELTHKEPLDVTNISQTNALHGKYGSIS